MSSARSSDDALIEEFLTQRGHESVETWETSYSKLQCPDCGGLHESTATNCSICGWAPDTLG